VPSELAPPSSLRHLPYFLVRYRREERKYELLEPHSTSSYDLGDAVKTRAYFLRVDMEYLGGRAMDSALAFGASQAWVKDQRAYGLDLCKVDLDAGLVRTDDLDNDRRLLDGEDDDDDVPFVSGILKHKG
jgi:hypothetical protein